MRWYWKKIAHLYGVDYKLERLVDGVSTTNTVPGYTGDVAVRLDMNRERYLWGYTLKQGGTIVKDGGHAPTAELAQEAAMRSLVKMTGHGEGTAGEVRADPAVPETDRRSEGPSRSA